MLSGVDPLTMACSGTEDGRVRIRQVAVAPGPDRDELFGAGDLRTGCGVGGGLRPGRRPPTDWELNASPHESQGDRRVDRARRASRRRCDPDARRTSAVASRPARGDAGGLYGWVVRPATSYAKSGDVNIAYHVFGEGPDLVLVPGFVSHLEVAWEWPYLARFLHRLSSFSRVIVFDKRGTGLSDPMKRPPTLEERLDDIRAVMDAVSVAKAPLFGISEGGSLSIAFAVEHPGRASALILYGSFAKKAAAADYPWGVSAEKLQVFLHSFDEAWASGDWWDVANPNPTIDRSHREWWARYLRVAASPGMARDLLTMNGQIDIRHLLPAVSVPTLVLHRTEDRWVEFGNGRYLADHIDGAKLVALPGDDHRVWLGDAEAALDEIETFLTGSRTRSRHPRTRTGPQSLSSREREVVRLAVADETTPDIARTMFLSERTIETHLSNAYTKLGVRSRRELVRVASGLDL